MFIKGEKGSYYNLDNCDMMCVRDKFIHGRIEGCTICVLIDETWYDIAEFTETAAAQAALDKMMVVQATTPHNHGSYYNMSTESLTYNNR